jgi:hypothetical protein
MSSELDKLRDYLSGDADEQTRREIREELARPGSPLADALAAARRMSRQMFGEASRTRHAEAGPSFPPAAADAWLSGAFAPVSSNQVPPSLAVWAQNLLSTWMQHLRLRYAGAIERSGPAPASAEQMPSSRDLYNWIQSGAPVTLGGEAKWVHVSVDDEGVHVRAGQSPADMFEAFGIEFHRAGAIIVGIASITGVVTLTPADFARAAAGQADTVVIRVTP